MIPTRQSGAWGVPVVGAGRGTSGWVRAAGKGLELLWSQRAARRACDGPGRCPQGLPA